MAQKGKAHWYFFGANSNSNQFESPPFFPVPKQKNEHKSQLSGKTLFWRILIQPQPSILSVWRAVRPYAVIESAFDFYGFLSNQSLHAPIPILVLSAPKGKQAAFDSNIAFVPAQADSSPTTLNEYLTEFLNQRFGRPHFATVIFVGPPEATQRFAVRPRLHFEEPSSD